MATHSCILVWEISWTEEPGRLQSQGVGHDLATKQPSIPLLIMHVIKRVLTPKQQEVGEYMTLYM